MDFSAFHRKGAITAFRFDIYRPTLLCRTVLDGSISHGKFSILQIDRSTFFLDVDVFLIIHIAVSDGTTIHGKCRCFFCTGSHHKLSLDITITFTDSNLSRTDFSIRCSCITTTNGTCTDNRIT